MDNQPNNTPSLDLPAPRAEQYPGASEQQPVAASSPEVSKATSAEQPGSGIMAPVTANPLSVAPPAPAPSTDPANSSATTSPLIADDSDLIEKEWVLKAKHIVEKTRSDPHEQNEAMNRVKADYLKKRYHKDIKLGSE